MAMKTAEKVTHTPGPWRYFENALGDGYLVERPVGEEMEYRVGLVHNVNGEDVNEANARLIAAAPEMLEALECAETILILLSEEVGHLGFNAKNVLPKVKAAIRKARGE